MKVLLGHETTCLSGTEKSTQTTPDERHGTSVNEAFSCALGAGSIIQSDLLGDECLSLDFGDLKKALEEEKE